MASIELRITPKFFSTGFLEEKFDDEGKLESSRLVTRHESVGTGKTVFWTITTNGVQIHVKEDEAEILELLYNQMLAASQRAQISMIKN